MGLWVQKESSKNDAKGQSLRGANSNPQVSELILIRSPSWPEAAPAEGAYERNIRVTGLSSDDNRHVYVLKGRAKPSRRLSTVQGALVPPKRRGQKTRQKRTFLS